MEPSCLRHTELPHSSRLFSDFQYHFDRVAAFYDHSPHDQAGYADSSAQIDYPAERRAALVSALREQNGDSPALQLLAQPGTRAVVTGQQVGLFSGPVYTIYKALTAARLARRLTAQGIPAVPVFWLASEDHDFQEINHCWLFDTEHRPARIEIPGAAPAQSPVGQIRIEQSPVGELRRLLDGYPFAGEVSDLVERAYSPGRLLSSAFGMLLEELLSSYGLLYLDPMRPAIRELAAPMLRKSLAAGPELTRLVLERSRILDDAGYHSQVHVEPQSTLLFLLEGGRRLSLKREDGDYVSGGRQYSAEDLAARAGELSPNALLRPVVQDYILPTVAYVGGPAEIAYLAQSQVLYHFLLKRMPVVLHRSSFTLLDARSEKLFRRYGLSVADLFHGEEAVREQIARQLVPPVLDRGLSEARRGTDEQFGRLRTELASFDPTLAAALEKSRAKVLHQFSRIERKVARESLRRSGRSAREASSMCGLVYPEKHLQERFYSVLPFLAKHGFDLIGHIYENVHLECPDHRVLVI